MACPNCGAETSERTAFCTQCGTSLPKQLGTAKKIFKRGGLGCGGLLVLFIVIVVVVRITTGIPSPEEQETPAGTLSSGTPSPALQTVREVFLASSESGDRLRAAGREFDDDFVQEAVSSVESEVFGKSGKWIISNSDVMAVCDVYSQVGDARKMGEDLATTEFENILREELGLKGSAIMGAIQSGISNDAEAIVDFCAPIHAYGVGFIAAFESAAELYELDLDETYASAQLVSAIDEMSRSELRTDRQTAYGQGFLAGMDAANEIGPEHDAPAPTVPPTPQTTVSTTCQPFCDWDFWVSVDEGRVLAELDRGANINAKDDRGLTPLHYAARSSTDSSVVALLLDRGSEVNATSTEGFTPLHAAVSGNTEPSVIELLLDRGADIEARDQNDATPLHHAVLFVNEDPSVLKLLLARGADVSAHTRHGDTACQFAGWWITDAMVLRKLCRY